jgi:glucose/mannose transport system permease protein
MFASSDRVAAALNVTILLVIVTVVVIPYLVYTNRTEEGIR